MRPLQIAAALILAAVLLFLLGALAQWGFIPYDPHNFVYLGLAVFAAAGLVPNR